MASNTTLSEPADNGETPIITSDKDEILDVRQLKKLRSTAKGLVTRKRNEINELLSTPMPHIDELKKRAQDLETVTEKFQISHENYHQNLKDEEDIEESNEYFEAEQTRVNYLIERIMNVIEHQSSIVHHIIEPHDSVSDTGKSKLLPSKHAKISCKSGSRISSSVRSTTSSAKAKAAAKKAALEVEAANYKKRMALQQEELQLQQKQEMLDLEIKLQKATAEEQAYIEIEKEKENHDSKSGHLQNVTQFSPSPKIEQTPAPGCSVNEAKHEQETPVKHQTLNPTAKEWPYSSKSGDQLILNSANETSEPNQNGIALQNSHTAYMMNMQTQQNQQLERMMTEQQRYTAALLLPQPEVPVFKGQPTEYCSFIRAFENLIESKTDSSSSRLYYLVQYTAGDVQELMRSCLAMNPDEGYQEARRLIKEKYGQNYKIAAAYVDRLTSGPPIRSEDGNALQKFSVQLTSCKNTLKDIGYLNKLENPDALRKLIERLPYGIRQKWREVVDDIIQRQNRDVTVEDIATFVEKRVRVATHPIFGNITSESKNNDSSKHRNRSGNGTPKGSSFGTNAESKQPSLPPETSNVKCPSCSQNHRLVQCPDFRKKTLEERLQFVRKKGLCNNCFARGHLAKTCEMPSFCRVKDCNFKHSTFLHPKGNANEKRNDAADPLESVNPKGSNEDRQLETVVQSAYVNTGGDVRSRRSQPVQVTSLAIVPVKVKAKNSSIMIETYAFLDGGSNTTFCSERLMNQLKAAGKRTTLSLTTMTQEDRPVESSIVSLELFDLQEENFIDLPKVFSTAKLPVSKENMATQQDAEKWPHLKDIEIPEIDAEVSLLIGSDVPQALEPLEIRRGRRGEPYATRTALGWVVNGPLGRTGTAPHSASFINADIKLNEQFEKFCNMEFNDSAFSNKTSMSQEDRRALDIMNESIKLEEGHYEMALPWRQRPPELPNDKSLAEHRLQLLKRRLTKDPLLHRKYTEFIDDLLRKGYAKRVHTAQPKELSTPVWYLPHHPVFHPQKPDKVRVVFDCSAKYRGTSLNAQLLQGPDLTNTLVGVLTRFREESVALMSDVEAMFHQVKVRPDDCNALRFLWWTDGDLSKQAEEFQMTVHLFGGTSSPSCANFALRKTADDNESDFDPETIHTIRRNFYVDDCLKAVKSETSAVKLADQLSRCLAKGGFRLTKWTSNSSQVIESIPESERAPTLRKLDFDKSKHVERPLGVQWNVATDTFGFTITIKDRPLTRRGVLSTVSSIYDPLGFAAPFILPAKAILQDLCRKKLGWDDPIPEEETHRWQQWLNELPKLEQFSVNRCFKPSEFGEIDSRQLHHFSDASQEGYGAVSYLRSVNTRGDIHCSFVLGKSRLAPLKPTTIPRMELSAAVVATRLEKMIQEELEEKPNCRSIFWSDSTCVLHYVENEDKRFQTFVANRIATIRDASLPIQWRYVDTKSNPADDASRGLSVHSFLEESRWLKGPQFLWLPEESWPQRPPGMNRKVEENDPEVKKEAKTCATRADITTCNALNRIFERISSWYRLKKFVAWMLRYKEQLKRQCARRTEGRSTTLQHGNKLISLSVEEMDLAGKEILKNVQRESFPEEVSNPSLIKKSSTIVKLDPKMVDGLLRVGGRLRHAPIGADAKYPIILPKRHHVTELLIREYHERCGHSGLEYVLSLLRQRFWIIKARSTIRRVLDSCFSCRRRQAPVGTQKMADLPKDRVTPNLPPFTNVGVDCFGPFTIRRGRSTVKRYGVLFTCLSCRAVHIEVAHSLDTDSFINAMRRFISRRGQPKEIRSDNGSNFVGGEKELREAINHWNHQQIHEFLLQESTKWTFNPPAGSHHGGVWERCIRTVRKVLAALLKEQTLDDEGLLTLICEVEAIVNGRPITKISDDPKDCEALTPNHLLLLRSGPVLPPAALVKEDQYTNRWRQVQYLADVFWRRWLREYLPSLQQRQKWNAPMRNFAVGDIVLVVDEKSPRGSWPLGRVQEVYPNKGDGHVRRVKVKTMKSALERPVDKIVLLESAKPAADE